MLQTAKNNSTNINRTNCNVVREMYGHICGRTEDHNSGQLIPDQMPYIFKSAMLPLTTVFHLVKG